MSAVDPFTTYRDLIDRRLAELLPQTGRPSEAARHSLLAPGKRLRAILTLLAAEESGARLEDALAPACAIEMVHTASLIFDDLPAMDDAALRRGRETPHVKFGEGVAILAGIGLLNGAFGALATAPGIHPSKKVQMAEVLSDAIGWRGLVGGQDLDLAASHDSIEEIHHGKTGVLFLAAVEIGHAVGDPAPGARQPALTAFATALGLAYQAIDDLLDTHADASLSGKTPGRDGGKVTALSRAETVEEAMGRIRQHLRAAHDAVAVSGEQDASPLSRFVPYLEGYLQTALRGAIG